MSEKSVVVTYQTQQTYCRCCNQSLAQEKVSAPMQIAITKETALSWSEWNDIVDYPEDLDGIVYEFVRETIYFYSATSYEKLLIDDAEYEKVKEFILKEVVEQYDDI